MAILNIVFGRVIEGSTKSVQLPSIANIESVQNLTYTATGWAGSNAFSSAGVVKFTPVDNNCYYWIKSTTPTQTIGAYISIDQGEFKYVEVGHKVWVKVAT